METALEKAKKDPESMKARILAVARKIFGEYGFHGTTMRMIAKEVGIDISTLHYHWGEKKDLYEAVIIDINNDLGRKFVEVEKIIHGRPLEERIEIGIDTMVDYLFLHPEISNLVLHRYFGKIRHEELVDFKVPEFTIDIVRSMGLKQDKQNISFSMASVLTIMNSIHSFISGEAFFRTIIRQNRDEYIAMVKKTLKDIFIPAFIYDKNKFE
ncbi:MAG: TetR/AcrR family transcriptional regulator [Desulfomonilia bacterium]|uniref:Putative DNA-binding transcriptional regulator n=1 Tax=anaerobic digester metagenome TaxID=1263854 RepID=A0A485LYL1_9ZZZZ|nr:TetR/AcrR family transcriptional regulator [Pseudomonadota bacterium]HON39728.1 TetR/AcrR family transcriptional regulator [Deltaproteobacteria bacterium]HPX17709.1 TetR/AcrR family transcriptional regulator [Deltaproteobacteria bacterium]HQA72972.1 TetR/AcrR family transcriptional regulator [Deltaproteobacteria bacterium]HRV37004.1 TetR/AcrR family transcriptional regulator [Desulfomonilia bacterium]